MRPEDYNPKAREAFGKSLIDIGVGIFKGIMLLFTVVPLTFMLKGAVDGTNKSISLADLFAFMSTPAYLSFLVVLAATFLVGHYFRKEGLRHIHEIEKPPPVSRDRPTELLSDTTTPNVQGQGRCAALSRSAPCTAGLGVSGGDRWLNLGWQRLGVVMAVLWCIAVSSFTFIEYREVLSERASNLSLPPPPKGFVIDPKTSAYFFSWQPVDLLSEGPYSFTRDFEFNVFSFLVVMVAPILAVWACGSVVGWVIRSFKRAKR